MMSTREFDISSIDEPASRPMAARVHVTHHRGWRHRPAAPARGTARDRGWSSCKRRHRELPARDHA